MPADKMLVVRFVDQVREFFIVDGKFRELTVIEVNLTHGPTISDDDFIDYLVRDNCANLRFKLACLPGVTGDKITTNTDIFSPSLLKSYRDDPAKLAAAEAELDAAQAARGR